MSAIAVCGQRPLTGQIQVQGSKNAVLPIMAASVLHKGTTVIENVPRIQDVFCMMGILTSLGCSCTLTGHRLAICAGSLSGCTVSREEMGQMRSSILLLGALLGRCGEACVYDPGGCRIGKRPIDLHLLALRALGAETKNADSDSEALYLTAKRLCGTEILFPYPSVGATENAIFAAAKAEGMTVLRGCAREPEIAELCRFLNGMGACILGAGSDTLVIKGGLPFRDSHYTVSGDRIAAGTYLLAAAGCRGEATLLGVPPGELSCVLCALRRMGAEIREENGIHLLKQKKRKSFCGSRIVTSPYPGFPTDLQSVMMAFMCTVKGESRIEETVFENRFRTVPELEKLGARISLDGKWARIFGGDMLSGAEVEAPDLRGGAALVAAGLFAEGKTIVHGCEHILRGYEDIVRDFRAMGAEISVSGSTGETASSRIEILCRDCRRESFYRSDQDEEGA